MCVVSVYSVCGMVYGCVCGIDLFTVCVWYGVWCMVVCVVWCMVCGCVCGIDLFTVGVWVVWCMVVCV